MRTTAPRPFFAPHHIILRASFPPFPPDVPGFHARRLAKYGRVYRSHALGAPLTCVADAAQVRRLLLGEGGAEPITATDWTPPVRALLGPESLLMKSGAAHAASRRILAQAFTGAAVDSYQPLVRDATARAVADWAAACAATPGATISALGKGKDLAFNVAARALIAGDMPEETMERFRADFDLFTLGFFGIPVPLPGTAFRRALAARERVLARIDTLVDAEAAAIAGEGAGRTPGVAASPPGRPKTALRLMMTADDPEHPGSKIGRGELRDQVVTQLFAGHETTGTTIARLMAFVTPARFPGVIKRLADEQGAVVARCGPDLTPEAMAAMPYLDCVIKETNRLFPIVSGVFRKALVDLAVCGYRVPAGERMMVMLGQTQSQVEEFQGDLADFLPERWLAFAKKDPPAFMPFGVGPHVCLGMGLALSEIKVVLATLVRDYEWGPTDPEAALKWRAPLLPADGVPVQVWKRGTPRPPLPVPPKAEVAVGADAWWVGA
jgi:cytochrome P450